MLSVLSVVFNFSKIASGTILALFKNHAIAKFFSNELVYFVANYCFQTFEKLTWKTHDLEFRIHTCSLKSGSDRISSQRSVIKLYKHGGCDGVAPAAAFSDLTS